MSQGCGGTPVSDRDEGMSTGSLATVSCRIYKETSTEGMHGAAVPPQCARSPQGIPVGLHHVGEHKGEAKMKQGSVSTTLALIAASDDTQLHYGNS